LCIGALLIACFASAVHKHDPNREGVCLICHVAQRAKVVAIASDAGKPYIASSGQVAASPKPALIPDAPNPARIPRAPPVILLSL